ncbi:hypothetical protein FQZ97_504630 [compost metagenome]
MDGHHLDQVGVAFQAEDFLAGRILQLLGQHPQQRVFAVQLHRLALQPFGQVQQVGQAALAVRLAQQARRQGEVGEQPAQHRQHALLLPLQAVFAEAQHGVFPEALVLVQPLQSLPVEIEAAGRQRGAQQGVVAGIGAGAQPVQQVAGFLAVEHRVAVGQVDAGQPPRRQLAADRLGLAAAAHEDGDIRRAQRAPLAILAETGAIPLRQRQPAADGAGAARGHFLAVVGGADHLAVFFQGPEGHGRQRLAVDQQRFRAAVGLHAMERHRVVARFIGEAEGATPVLLGEGEAAVRRGHHVQRRAVVGAQGVVAPGGGGAGAQVGVDIGAAEGVDRLLGVADQEQAEVLRVLGDAVDTLEDAVLQRVGVLEFVDQRHRELLADALRQMLAAGAGQGAVEAQQQVVETEFGAALLLRFQRRAHLAEGVQQQAGGDVRAISVKVQQGIDGLQRGVRGHLGLALQPDPRLAELAEIVRRRAALAPGGQGFQPAGKNGVVVLAAIAGPVEAGAQLVQQFFQPGAVGLPGLAGAGFGGVAGGVPVAGALQQRGEGFRRLQRPVGVAEAGFLLRQQRLQRAGQRLGAGPAVRHGSRRAAAERIEVAPPVVAHGFGEQLALVGGEVLGEQAAAVEGVLAQHAVAPAVDGRDGGLVHPFGGHAQQTRAAGPAFGGIGIAQFHQQAVVLCIRLGEAARGLGQARADAVAQFLGGGVGEGHHEDFRRAQRPAERLLAAVGQHQPHIQQGDGEGLAGTGAGLDQAAAVQGEVQYVELHGRAHAASSASS